MPTLSPTYKKLLDPIQYMIMSKVATLDMIAMRGGFPVEEIIEKISDKIKAEEIGKAAMVIGAGRATKEDEVDHAVGIELKKKVGDKVEKGDVIAEIYYNDEKNVQSSKAMVLDAYVIGKEKIENIKNILEVIE